MILDENKILASQRAFDVQRQPQCPDDYAIASYMEGGLGGQEHKQLELHIAECDFCLAIVGLLGRAADSEPESAVSDVLVERSARMVKAGKKPARRKTGVFIPAHLRWATAAVLLLACGLFIAFDSDKRAGLTSPPPVGFPESVRNERNIGTISMTPVLVSPVEGSTIDPRSQTFAWSHVKDSLFYQVRIVNDEGDLLWQEQTTASQWKLPAQLPLENDRDYFVRIDAFLSQSKSLDSDYVVFRVLQTD